MLSRSSEGQELKVQLGEGWFLLGREEDPLPRRRASPFCPFTQSSVRISVPFAQDTRHSDEGPPGSHVTSSELITPAVTLFPKVTL